LPIGSNPEDNASTVIIRQGVDPPADRDLGDTMRPARALVVVLLVVLIGFAGSDKNCVFPARNRVDKLFAI
jgi:hypothetical protein